MTTLVCHSGDTPTPRNKCRKGSFGPPPVLHFIFKKLEELVFNPKTVVMLSFQ